jgi:hypothetical protein
VSNRLQSSRSLADPFYRLAKSRKLQHSGVEEHGENIFVSTEDVSLDKAVKSWLAEEKDYDGEKFGEGNSVKYVHFSKRFYVHMCLSGI